MSNPPLYLYTTPESTSGTLFATTKTTRQPNLSLDFIQAVSGKLGLSFTFDASEQPIEPPSATDFAAFTPEDIFYYAYAIFHSPTYRQRYAEFLKIDFPRLPLTSDAALFRRLAQLGYELVSLHLLQAPQLHPLRTRFPVSGDNEVARPRYVKPQQSTADGQTVFTPGRVYINNTQFFEGIEPAVW